MLACFKCPQISVFIPVKQQTVLFRNIGSARGARAHFSVWTATRAVDGTSETATPTATTSFSELGLPLELLDSLERAFPHVQAPTASQSALIRAILSNDNKSSVILRDVTGSGKSLALLLALLSDKQISRPFHKAKARRAVKATRKKASLETILLVPHTELAKQFEAWLARLRVSPPSDQHTTLLDELPASQPDSPQGLQSAIAAPTFSTEHRHLASTKGYPALQHTQVLHRQSTKTIDISTRFLITTPRCLIDLLDSISTEHVHTIALDEADEMLKLPNRFHTHKDEAKWLRHPPLLLAIMDEILSSPRAGDRLTTIALPEQRIVAVSASANSVFRDYLVRRSGWLKAASHENENNGQEGRRVDWYDFSSEPFKPSENSDVEGGLSDLQRVGRALMPQALINHYLVRVDDQGEFVYGESQPLPSPQEEALSSLPDPNRYLVAAASLFALKRIERGLLLIPSSQSLKATLDFLQSLAVPAVGVSEAFMTSESPEDTVLYVASVDSVRGLDIPQLEWIFLPPTIKAQDDAKDYMHITGRVGRLLDSQGTRGSGNVVSLVDSSDYRQEGKLHNVWQLLGIEGRVMSPEELPQLPVA